LVQPAPLARIRIGHDQVGPEGVGCLRTLTGAAQFCTIRSYLATAAKHNIGTFHALLTLAQGHAWLPETA
jgi:hypothetical protein